MTNVIDKAAFVDPQENSKAGQPLQTEIPTKIT